MIVSNALTGLPEYSLVVTAPGAAGASVLGLSTTQGQSAAKARHPAFQASVGASNDDLKRCGRGHNLGLNTHTGVDGVARVQLGCAWIGDSIFSARKAKGLLYYVCDVGI